MSILLVDPTPHIRQLYAVNLRTFGLMIHEANTFYAAWHASLICHPRLIIMETASSTEEGGALQFLTRLAESPHGAHIPVLIITTQSDNLDSYREMKNVQDIMIKPIKRRDLLDAVKSILGVPISFRKLVDA